MPFDLGSATVEIRADDAKLSSQLARARDALGRFTDKEHVVKFRVEDPDVFAKGFGARDDSIYHFADANQRFADSLAKAKAALKSLPARKTVDVSARTGGFMAAIGKAKAALASAFGSGSAGGAAASILPAAAAAGGVGAAVAVGGEALKAAVLRASDLNETVSKTQVIFQGASQSVIDFAGSMAQTFGTSRQEVLDAAGGFGLIAKAAGMSADEAAKLAINFARLADDASSFYNVSVGDALEKIRSGLVGESEPLRAFGVLLSEDAVKAEAFRLGIARVGSELNEQQKVMARASLIEQGLAVARGDHARTFDSFTSQLRELKGRFEGIAISLGLAVLPAFNAFLSVLNPLVRKIAWVAERVREVSDLFSDFFSRASEAIGVGSKAAEVVSAPTTLDGAGGGEGGKAGAASAASAAKGFGLDAAREAVAKERAQADQKRLEERVRNEAEAARKSQWIEKMNVEFYKEQWIAAEAAKKRARMKMSEWAINAGDQAEEGKFLDRQAKMFATRDYEVKRLEAGGVLKPKEDITKPIRDANERRWSVIKEAFAKLPALKQQGLGVVGGAMNAFVAQGAQARAEKADRQELQDQRDKMLRERQRNFAPEFFSGGQDYRNAAQAEILRRNDPEVKDQRERNKQIAKNTAETVTALKNLATTFASSVKSFGQTTAAFAK